MEVSGCRGVMIWRGEDAEVSRYGGFRMQRGQDGEVSVCGGVRMSAFEVYKITDGDDKAPTSGVGPMNKSLHNYISL